MNLLVIFLQIITLILKFQLRLEIIIECFVAVKQNDLQLRDEEEEWMNLMFPPLFILLELKMMSHKIDFIFIILKIMN